MIEFVDICYSIDDARMKRIEIKISGKSGKFFKQQKQTKTKENAKNQKNEEKPKKLLIEY